MLSFSDAQCGVTCKNIYDLVLQSYYTKKRCYFSSSYGQVRPRKEKKKKGKKLKLQLELKASNLKHSQILHITSVLEVCTYWLQVHP